MSIYRIQNKVWWYCFQWTKEECEKIFKDYFKENWFNPKWWKIVKYSLEDKVRDHNKKHWIQKEIWNKWQIRADKILERMLYFNIKHKSWYKPMSVRFVWPPSWFYGYLEVKLENWDIISIWWLWFRPNVDDISKEFPYYNKYKWKRIKKQ